MLLSQWSLMHQLHGELFHPIMWIMVEVSHRLPRELKGIWAEGCCLTLERCLHPLLKYELCVTAASSAPCSSPKAGPKRGCCCLLTHRRHACLVLLRPPSQIGFNSTLCRWCILLIEQCLFPIVTTDQQRPANHLGSFDLPQLGSSITGCFAVHCTLFTVWSAHCNVAVKGLCEELTVAQGEGLPITES